MEHCGFPEYECSREVMDITAVYRIALDEVAGKRRFIKVKAGAALARGLRAPCLRRRAEKSILESGRAKREFYEMRETMWPARNDADRILQEATPFIPALGRRTAGWWRGARRKIAGRVRGHWTRRRHTRWGFCMTSAAGLAPPTWPRDRRIHFLMEFGYDEAAKICITHSFADRNLDSYIGGRDVSAEDYALIARVNLRRV
jgi:hypothetical protein